MPSPGTWVEPELLQAPTASKRNMGLHKEDQLEENFYLRALEVPSRPPRSGSAGFSVRRKVKHMAQDVVGMAWGLAFLPPWPCGTQNSSPPSSHFLPGLGVSVSLAIVVFSFLALALVIHFLLQLGKSPTTPPGTKTAQD